MRDLAEHGVLQGNPGPYGSTGDGADVNVPATLQATIAARIDRLDPKAKRTLSAAAVVGSRFGLDLLKVLGFEPVVDELVGAELIDQVRFTREPEFVFHHPLIRAVAYEAQLKSDRAELHRSVAAAIEQREPDSVDENAALIATIWRPLVTCIPLTHGICGQVRGQPTATSPPHNSVGSALASLPTLCAATSQDFCHCGSRPARC